MQFTSYPNSHVIWLSVSVSLECFHSIHSSHPGIATGARAGSVVDIGLASGLCAYDTYVQSLERSEDLSIGDSTFCGEASCTLRFG